MKKSTTSIKKSSKKPISLTKCLSDLESIVSNCDKKKIIHQKTTPKYRKVVKTKIFPGLKKALGEEGAGAKITTRQEKGRFKNSVDIAILKCLADLQVDVSLPILGYDKNLAFLRNGASVVCQLLKNSKEYLTKQSYTSIFEANRLLNSLVKLDLSIDHHLENEPSNIEITADIATLILNRVIKQLDKKKRIHSPSIVRLIHNILLLETDGKKILDKEQLQLLIDSIEHNIDKIKDESDVNFEMLCSQLYIIRNKCTHIKFPEALSHLIDPFLSKMQENAHGSNFEVKIFSQLDRAADELSEIYPKLISPHDLDANNPILKGLGLEADILYRSPLGVDCVFQVDGDKYHTFSGLSGTNVDKKTRLRDEMCHENNLSVVNFSDKNNGVQFAKDKLIEHVVQPSYDILKTKALKAHDYLKKFVSTYQGNAFSSAQTEKFNHLINEYSRFLKSHPNFILKFSLGDLKKVAHLQNQANHLKSAAPYIEPNRLFTSYSTRLKKLNAQHTQLKKSLAPEEKLLKANKGELDQTSLRITSLQSKINAYQQEITKSETSIKALQEELATLENQNKTNQIKGGTYIRKKKKILEEQSSLKGKISNANRFKKRAQNTLSKEQETLKDLKQRHTKMEKSFAQHKAQLTSTDEAITRHLELLDSSKNKLLDFDFQGQLSQLNTIDAHVPLDQFFDKKLKHFQEVLDKQKAVLKAPQKGIKRPKSKAIKVK